MFNWKYYNVRLQRESICFLKKVYSILLPFRGKPKTLLVVGAQRSGTNLLMDVLERSFQTDVFHERDNRAFLNYLMRPVPEINELKSKSNFEFFVIKGLCESHRTDQLLEQFSPAKVIWVIRDFNDVVNSMDISFKETQDIMINVAKDRSAGGWRTEDMSDETYSLIKAHVHDNISNKSASALQWYIRNIVYFEKNFTANKDIKLLNYNKLVVNPKKVVNSIYDFTGIPANQIMHSIINSNSIKKNREPAIDEGIREMCDELWDRFIKLPDNLKL